MASGSATKLPDRREIGDASFPEPLDAAALQLAWDEVWRLAGARPSAGLMVELLQAWSEPHRHYHDVRHLGECLAFWTRWLDLAQRPAEVALALWFHDAVYDPRASDNELKSAAWAARELGAAGVETETTQRVCGLVLATAHATSAAVADTDAQLLTDIDLAILGAPPERFERYNADIREEYGFVPEFRYRMLRAEVLKRFTERPQIYHSPAAVRLLERQAHLNLAAALSRLDH